MKPILPGAAVGVLGSGQLGRMFAIAARRMGYRVHTFSPDFDTPTGQVSDLEVTASYDDLDAVRAFARGVAAVTFEFENVPAPTAETVAALVPVRPAGSVLHTTQQRIREKTFLRKTGIPVAPFRVVRSPADLARAVSEIGCPAVLKTADFGYDGKGQATIHSAEAAEAGWNEIGRGDAVLEAFVDFECELSLVGARAADGGFAHYGLVENRHCEHILDVTIAPAPQSGQVTNEAVQIARTVLETLDVVGVLCVEFFLTRDGRLLVNELAPRPHNSGHFSIDACVTSQFEQQLRAVCGLPLGSTRQLSPAAMANLLGDLWIEGEPDWPAACGQPDVKLHLYGKLEPRRKRKMGHLTALAEEARKAARLAVSARELLSRGAGYGAC
ncbi:MAG: 5-(carboxyamino)imidazole ribonucleotide synthase [Bryobacteraceae bacterium]